MIAATAELAIEDVREARGRVLEDALHYLAAPGAEFGRWHATALGVNPDAARARVLVVLAVRFGRARARELWLRCGGALAFLERWQEDEGGAVAAQEGTTWR